MDTSIAIAASKTFKPPIAIATDSWDYANGAIAALCAAGYKVTYKAENTIKDAWLDNETSLLMETK